MVLWPAELKLCREMGTQPTNEGYSLCSDWVAKPPRVRGIKIIGFWGPGSLNHVVCPGLYVEAGFDLADGRSFAAG